MQEYFNPLKNQLSETSQKRLETNPLRILDTKNPEEQKLLANAPRISDFWTGDDTDHFSRVQSLLSDLDIPFELDTQMVRGLDYYTRTTFEFISGNLGAQDAVCGGGRYDGLVEILGGKPTPAMGFAAGMERILMSMDPKEKNAEVNSVYLINMVESASGKALSIANEIRELGFAVTIDTLRRSIKAQLRDANRIGAVKVIIMGEEELKNKTLQIKDLTTGEQEEIVESDLVKHFTV